MNRKRNGIFAVCGILLTVLCACEKQSTNNAWAGYDSAPYITALASGEYSLEMSMLYNGVIVTNELCVKDGNIESRSTVGESVSHSMRLGDATYFIDDENRVYFKTAAVGQNGLSGTIDYATAEFTSSGTETLLTGSTYAYDEYACETYDGRECAVRLYVTDDGNLAAIVNSNGTESFEQDIAAFSDKVNGKIRLPKAYAEVDEDTYFDEYYGK